MVPGSNQAGGTFFPNHLQGFTAHNLPVCTSLSPSHCLCITKILLKRTLNRTHVFMPGRVAQSVGHLTRKSGVLGFDTQSGNILSFLLPLFQEGQLSVTGESMCTKYWLTA